MTVGRRLRDAIEAWARGGYRAFSRELEARGVRGSSRPTINSYIAGETSPTAEFLAAAVEILSVRKEWLLLGAGEPTEEAEAAARRKRERERRWSEELDAQDREWLEKAEPGDSEESRRRRSAILHFARKLDRLEFPGAPWARHPLESSEAHPEARRELLESALIFVRGVEEAWKRAARQHPDHPDESLRRFTKDWILLGHSHSEAWNSLWLDWILELFAQRVRGLGVRMGPDDSGFLYDSHEGVIFGHYGATRSRLRLAERNDDEREEDHNGQA